MDIIQQFSTWFQSVFSGNAWVAVVFTTVLVTAFLHYFERRVYNRLHPIFQSTNKLWDDIAATALHAPLGLLIWVLGLSFAAMIVSDHLNNAVFLKAVITLKEMGCFPDDGPARTIWASVKEPSSMLFRFFEDK